MRRALQLAASGGLELYERIEAIFAALPQVDWPAAHALSDQLGVTAPGAALRGLLQPVSRSAGAAGARARRRGSGEAPELALAQRLIPEARLPAWAELWETVLRERDEAVLLNLDRKALITGHVRAPRGPGAALSEDAHAVGCRSALPVALRPFRDS